MSFERPLLALLALAFIPAVCVFSRFFKGVLTIETPLGPPGGGAFRPPGMLGVFIAILRALEILGAALLLFAAAGPRLSRTETLWLSRGAEVIFVLDVSPSMAALDMDGESRFSLARRLLWDFARRRAADAVGLVAVGNDAALLLPPTTDRALLRDRLDALKIGEMGDGTAIGLGIATAARHLKAGSAAGGNAAPRRALILITDGENNAGSIHPEAAVALLPPLGISFYVMAVGSTGEVAIDYVDPFTRRRRTGIFDSRFNADALALLAQRGEGTYLAAPRPESFAEAFRTLDGAEVVIRRAGSYTALRPIHQGLLLAALFLLAGTHFIRRALLGALL